MHSFIPALVALLSLSPSLSAAAPGHRPPHHGGSGGGKKGPSCLSDSEAREISTRWLSIFWSNNNITSVAQLGKIVAQNITSADDTFGPPTHGIEELYANIGPSGPNPVNNVVQTPLFLLHSCDQIGLRWQYNGTTTGYDSTVPAGTKVSFQGNDILTVDLDTKLITNAVSSGDWILLARQLGQTCDV